MFWKGNFIAVNDVNFLLKEENVTLGQVLEADDILSECRADNKALRQFLTKPEIRAELITLITEEPSKNLELTMQYRHAQIASEVLTSQLATLREQLAMDSVQMNRLCDFVNKPPPLNPLLASYFSKTIEMLFERNPKQDWYAHHIVCLHALDLFKSRRDFLPNLLRHISTSAICDVFKCLFNLRDPDKIIMEWLDEHQVHENLIHIICGTYEPEPLPPPPAPPAPAPAPTTQEGPATEALDSNHNDSQPNGETDTGKENTSQQNDSTAPLHTDEAGAAEERNAREGREGREGRGDTREARIREVASANAAALLCEVSLQYFGVNTYGAVDVSGAGATLARRLRGDAGVRALLQAAFTAPAHAARAALLHAATLLRALLVLPESDVCAGCACGPDAQADLLCAVVHAVAPHVPLLHHALLRPPGAGAGVGAARVAVAAVIARLARSEAEDVFQVLLSLGTANVLLDMVFAYPENNFLHAQVLDFVHNALANRVHGDRYAAHLVDDCNILTRLMDAFEENEDKLSATSARRAGYMGHVVAMLRALDLACVCGGGRGAAGGAVAARWDKFLDARLLPHLKRIDTPLGGVHPSDTQYEMEESPEMPCGSYDLGEGVEAELAEEAAESDLPGGANHMKNELKFLRLSDQRFEDMWGDTADADDDVVQQVLTEVSPWESAAGGGADDGGWARFTDAFNSDWPENEKEDPLTVELAQKMLDAIGCFGAEKDERPAEPERPSCLDFPPLDCFTYPGLDEESHADESTAPETSAAEPPAPAASEPPSGVSASESSAAGASTSDPSAPVTSELEPPAPFASESTTELSTSVPEPPAAEPSAPAPAAEPTPEPTPEPAAELSAADPPADDAAS